MATGTDGPDTLANDQTLRSETINALGGDDRINVRPPHPPGDSTQYSSITVNGGSGFDTLAISAPFIDLSPGYAFINEGTATGFSISIYRYPANVFFSEVERLVASGSAYFSRARDGSFTPGGWSTGDTIDEIHVLSTRGAAQITVATNGGDDKVYLGNVGTGSTVYGGLGNDLIDLTGTGGIIAFGFGDPGDDILRGGPGNNWLDGGAGADFLFLEQGGADFAYGKDGNDVLYFGPTLAADDPADGGAGIDQIALRGDYTIAFGAGQLVGIEQIGLVSAFDTRFGPLADPYQYNLTMHDGNVAAGLQMTIDAAPLRPAENLVFNGSAETDGGFRVFGGEANDSILGGQTGDTVAGGGGGDTMFGNAGNDVFRYNASTDSTPAAQDLIRDFALGDVIDLSRIDADSLAAGNQAFSFIGSAGFGGRAGELRVEDQRNPIWLVQGDTDGDGAADFELLLVAVGRHIPTSGDFIL